MLQSLYFYMILSFDRKLIFAVPQFSKDNEQQLKNEFLSYSTFYISYMIDFEYKRSENLITSYVFS